MGWLLNDDDVALTEWYEARVSEVLGHQKYSNGRALFRRFVGPRRHSTSYAAVAQLMWMSDKIGRAEGKELMSHLSSAAPRTRRALLLAIDSALSGGEQSAWRRRTKAMDQGDLLADWMKQDFESTQALRRKWAELHWKRREGDVG